MAGALEYRGSVREVVSGAFRGLRDRSDLAASMIERVEENENAQAEQIDGGK